MIVKKYGSYSGMGKSSKKDNKKTSKDVFLHDIIEKRKTEKEE
jgi:hypothetical protein